MHTTTEHRQASRAPQAAGFEVRFQSLFNEGRALAFPCDAQGHVDCNALPERARLNYLFARAMIGREFAFPAVRSCASRTH